MKVKITAATCSFLALGTTIYRLYKRRGRFWADDFWALFALVALIIQLVVLFLPVIIPVRPQPNSLTNKSRRRMTQHAEQVASRLSILFSIIRIEPSAQRRRLLFWVAGTFVAAALFLLGQLFWVCEPNLSASCELSPQVGICQIVTDFIADSILLLAPLPLFRTLIDKSLGYKLTLLFSTCVVTTIVSLVHSAFILTDDDKKILISAIVEDCLSLIVANIPVIITTTIDIVGEPDQAQTGKSVQLTSVFWFSEAQTTGTMELHTIAEDPAKLSYAIKNTATSAWNHNDLPVSEGTVVDKLSCTKPVVVFVDPLLPI
ncbi:hypothetical protein B0H13DRAFT_1707824 [Mycena leptocephala]|nr:hypothetical protein B0H13DRAFT_1707824 [Mycena leptocephala]